MRKTTYLNFDLDKPDELLCYNFLESLGRAKKSVVIMALKNTQLLQNYTGAGNMQSLSMQGMAFPEPSKGKVGNKRLGKSGPKETEKVKAAQEIPVYEENTEPEDFSVEEEPEDFSVEEEPEEIFSDEQLIKIREKGLDLDALTDSQKRAMAKMMAEQFMPAATAYSLAGFEK